MNIKGIGESKAAPAQSKGGGLKKLAMPSNNKPSGGQRKVIPSAGGSGAQSEALTFGGGTGEANNNLIGLLAPNQSGQDQQNTASIDIFGGGGPTSGNNNLLSMDFGAAP